MFIGGPDTGKTNFLMRLWLSINAGQCIGVSIDGLPEELSYIESIMQYWLSGTFAQRTDVNLKMDVTSLTIPLTYNVSDNETKSKLFLPDVNGELWKTAVETNEINAEWMSQLESSHGVVIFIRPSSTQNYAPLDWVSSGQLIELMEDNPHKNQIPTQVMLCEFLRLLEIKFSRNLNSTKPRISVILTGWDVYDDAVRNDGPNAYIEKQYPLFAGKLRHLEAFDVEVFASSVFGGDIESDIALRDKLLEMGFEESGYIVHDSQNGLVESKDFFQPIAWALGLI